MKHVLKWAVPVDDQWHPIGGGRVVHVDTQNTGRRMVFVWTEELVGREHDVRPARVFGTGHEIPIDVEHLGSVQIPPFVWHVFGGKIEVRT